MGDTIIVSKKEERRNSLLEAVKSGTLTLREAAEKMEVSYRQARRLNKRFKVGGLSALAHRNRGCPSGRMLAPEIKEKILRLYQAQYADFGPTFAAEKLKERDKCEVNAETLRLWLIAAGLWRGRRYHKEYRQRRERRAQFGDLLQIDGSDHAWFGEIQGRCCLLNMVDDATGITLAQLANGETTEILLTVLWKWIELYGVPKAVYVDLKSVYISPKRLKLEKDEESEIEGFSVFQEVCKRLDIEVIKAYSPQAKGRVERKHGVFQDRFVKELSLRAIKTIAEANNFLLKLDLLVFSQSCRML